jgi:ATP-binding protein involved in chromosome partitioning
VAEPDSKIAATYKQIARRAAVRLSELTLDHTHKFPNIVIQNT